MPQYHHICITFATTAALSSQYTSLLNIAGAKMSNNNPAFIGPLSGNDGFQVDSSNNLRTSGYISCQSFLCTSVKVNNFSMPLFNNGSSSSGSSAVIPIYLTQNSVYNLVEIKMSFSVNTLSSLLTFSGNTQSDGLGTNISLAETGETATACTSQGTPTYTQNGTIAINIPAVGIVNQLRFCITKGNNSTGYSNRNYYTFEASYCQNGVGATRCIGIGHFVSTSLASIILKPTGGTINTNWNTIHYY